MLTAEFDFKLPDELIAQHPLPDRELSRLLVLERSKPELRHLAFMDLSLFLQEGDVLVLNDSKVFPARLRACNRVTGGRFEILLLQETAANVWWAMMKPGKRARPGTALEILDREGKVTGLSARVVGQNDEGHRHLEFSGARPVTDYLEECGEVPLPPYIHRSPGGDQGVDRERYQTIFARHRGSVAAPTAGLHFSHSLLDRLRARGVRICYVTLHVGLGTFAPVKAISLDDHIMHEECYALGQETVQTISEARRSGRRIIAVGTTTVRVLESVAREHGGLLHAGTGRTRIFIHPPYTFQVVDALITNFHLPRSTLLMLVSAFASPGKVDGSSRVLAAYEEAIRQKYRFFSYGDAMLIL